MAGIAAARITGAGITMARITGIGISAAGITKDIPDPVILVHL